MNAIEVMLAKTLGNIQQQVQQQIGALGSKLESGLSVENAAGLLGFDKVGSAQETSPPPALRPPSQVRVAPKDHGGLKGRLRQLGSTKVVRSTMGVVKVGASLTPAGAAVVGGIQVLKKAR